MTSDEFDDLQEEPQDDDLEEDPGLPWAFISGAVLGAVCGGLGAAMAVIAMLTR